MPYKIILLTGNPPRGSGGWEERRRSQLGTGGVRWAEEMEEARDEFSGGWVRASSSYVQGWASTAATGVATCRVIKQ